jgi:predicted DNA-binding transcriptional regulator AlpA
MQPSKISKPIDPDLISTEATGALLGFGVRKVVRLADLGQLPAPFRFGDKCIRFSRREIEAFVAKRDADIKAEAEAKAAAAAEKAARTAERKVAAANKSSSATVSA